MLRWRLLTSTSVLWYDELRRISASHRTLPAPTDGYAASAPAVYAASADVEKYITPSPVMSYAAPAFVIDYIIPVPAVYAASARVVEYISPAPAISYIAPAPVVEYTSPVLADYAASARKVECFSPAPTVSYAAAAPLQYAAPVRHAAPTMTVTRIDLNEMGFHMYSSDLRLAMPRPRSTEHQSTRRTSEYAPALKHTMIVTGVNMNRDGIQMSILCSTMLPYSWNNNK